MTVSALIDFFGSGDKKPTATIYRFDDGQPENLGRDLVSFVAEVRTHVKDKRFTDPDYLASRWIVYEALRYHAESVAIEDNPKKFQRHYLDFLGCSIMSSEEDSEQVQFRYHVICDGKPTLLCVRPNRIDLAKTILPRTFPLHTWMFSPPHFIKPFSSEE